MKRARRRREGKGGLELLEEAAQLLRTAPIATLAVYYLGAIPFLLGLLYFWTDMSRSPFASQHVAEAALAMTALFLWMKFCQSVFASRIRAQIASLPMPRWSFRQCVRVFLAQAIVQPSGLFVIPVALLLAIPFGWIYAFYQNATALGEGDDRAKLVKKSWQQASLWAGQNHILLSIASGFGFCVFLNWISVVLMLPHLIKTLFGIETFFTRGPIWAMLNITFLLTVGALTYLCLDPLMKASYVLRCFYGESLKTGQDLKVELKHYSSLRSQALAVLLLLLALAGAPIGRAADAPPAAPASSPQAPPPGVSPVELDRAINETIHERKYTWRMPREKVSDSDSENSLLTRFLQKAANLLRKWVKTIFGWLDRVIQWIQKLFKIQKPGASGSGYGWIMSLQILLYALGAAILVALVVLLLRTWRRKRRPAAVAAEPIQPAPDLTDENVSADQLPEDSWTRLARELLERGEFRLAMRAFYLGSLAHLAQRNLISLARFKSNRDYSLELGRRGHSFPELLSAFGDNVSVFERIWYGMHDVNRDLVDRFAASVERIKAGQ